MYSTLLIFHVIACLVLILVVLLQAGRGGGFSDMMGGGQPQSLFGTQTNVFMTRATEVCAVIFIVTSLSLGILSTQRGKSLVEKRHFATELQKRIPKLPATKASADVPPATKASADVPPATKASAPARQSSDGGDVPPAAPAEADVKK